MKHIELATEIIAKEEGFRAEVYRCTEGFPTVGYGQVVGNKNAPIEHFNFAMPERVAREWLCVNIQKIDSSLLAHDFYNNASPERQAVFISMAYQMGLTGLLRFRKMISAASVSDWETAATEALNSLWARQTPKRAERHADTLRSGNL